MVRRAAMIAMLGWVMVLGSASAGNAGNDLAYYYTLAMANDPQWRAAQYRQQATGEAIYQAWGRFGPTVSANADFTQNTQDIRKSENTVYTTGKSMYDSRNYVIQAVQPIFHYDTIAGLFQARTTVKRGDAELELAKQDLMIRMADLYFSLLQAQDNLTFVETELRAVEQHYQLAKLRHTSGLVSITDLNDSQARLATVQADKAEGERLLEAARQAFLETAGQVPEQINPMRGDIVFEMPVPEDVNLWLEGGAKKNLAILIKQFEVDEAKKEIEKQRGGHFPYVDGVGAWNRKDTAGSLFGGGSVVDETTFTLRIGLPLFSGGIVSSKVREAHALYQKTSQELTRQERVTVRQIRDYFQGVKSSAIRVDALKKSVDSQSLVVEAKEKGFRTGRYSTISVLDASRDLYFYRKSYTKARYEYVLNYLKLKQAAGIMNDEDLQKINSWLN